MRRALVLALALSSFCAGYLLRSVRQAPYPAQRASARSRPSPVVDGMRQLEERAQALQFEVARLRRLIDQRSSEEPRRTANIAAEAAQQSSAVSTKHDETRPTMVVLDYDADGTPDLYLQAVDGDRLYLGGGHGRYTEQALR